MDTWEVIFILDLIFQNSVFHTAHEKKTNIQPSFSMFSIFLSGYRTRVRVSSTCLVVKWSNVDKTAPSPHWDSPVFLCLKLKFRNVK